MTTQKTTSDRELNRDPITGEPGAHPIGAGIGATSGAIAGAAAGAIAGPIGAAVGVVIGAVAGGLVGTGAGEELNPTVDESYWRDNYRNEPYYDSRYTFEDYRQAYRVGYACRLDEPDAHWDEVEADIQSDWVGHERESALPWEIARHAIRAAWDRLADPQRSGGTYY